MFCCLEIVIQKSGNEKENPFTNVKKWTASYELSDIGSYAAQAYLCDTQIRCNTAEWHSLK